LRQSGLFGAYLWGETERVGKCCYKFTFFYKNKGVFVLSFKVTLSRLTTVLCDKRMERKKSMLESDRGKQFMTLYTKVQRRLYGYVLSNIPNPYYVVGIRQIPTGDEFFRMDIMYCPLSDSEPSQKGPEEKQIVQ
jgi:hypothetical protein